VSELGVLWKQRLRRLANTTSLMVRCPTAERAGLEQRTTYPQPTLRRPPACSTVSAMQRFDAIVLGAGIVGVSAAWHLLRRGKTVALVDRRAPGEETSHGNAGVVERDGFLPMSFPQKLGDLFRYGLNREPQLHYHRAF
jgi:hypothetical protein